MYRTVRPLAAAMTACLCLAATAATADQLGAGLGYRIGGSDDRPVIVGLDYRHHAAADPTFKGSVTGTPFDAEVGGNYVGVGLRFGL